MMDALTSAIQAAKNRLPPVICRLDEPMKNHTSFRIGGSVRAMFFPESAADLTELLSLFHERGVEPLTMGNGTNMLVADSALDIVVIKTSGACGIERSDENTITADAGVSLSRLAVFACENGLSGLEFAHGIPGTLGGAVAINAGAYGGEMKDVIHTTTAFKPGKGMSEPRGEEHGFSYRHSRFLDSREIVLRSCVRLRKADKERIRAEMDELSARRMESQPLDLPSAGSVFKRPENGYAAALIDRAGLKGYTVGGAQVSEKHSGFIVNRGGASYSDVMAVIEFVREKVLQRAGVELELELRIIRGI